MDDRKKKLTLKSPLSLETQAKLYAVMGKDALPFPGKTGNTPHDHKAWLEKITQTQAWLRRKWPHLFDPQKPVPLKIGIMEDILEHVKSPITRKQIRKAISAWTGRTAYLRAVMNGKNRYNLDRTASNMGMGEFQNRENYISKPRELQTSRALFSTFRNGTLTFEFSRKGGLKIESQIIDFDKGILSEKNIISTIPVNNITIQEEDSITDIDETLVDECEMLCELTDVDYKESTETLPNMPSFLFGLATPIKNDCNEFVSTSEDSISIAVEVSEDNENKVDDTHVKKKKTRRFLQKGGKKK